MSKNTSLHLSSESKEKASTNATKAPVPGATVDAPISAPVKVGPVAPKAVFMGVKKTTVGPVRSVSKFVPKAPGDTPKTKRPSKSGRSAEADKKKKRKKHRKKSKKGRKQKAKSGPTFDTGTPTTSDSSKTTATVKSASSETKTIAPNGKQLQSPPSLMLLGKIPKTPSGSMVIAAQDADDDEEEVNGEAEAPDGTAKKTANFPMTSPEKNPAVSADASVAAPKSLNVNVNKKVLTCSTTTNLASSVLSGSPTPKMTFPMPNGPSVSKTASSSIALKSALTSPASSVTLTTSSVSSPMTSTLASSSAVSVPRSADVKTTTLVEPTKCSIM